MSLRDLLPFRNNAQSRFDSWPPAPSVRPIQAGKAGGFPSAFPDYAPAEPSQRDPALVMAFGPTGEKTLRLWLEKLAGDVSAEYDNLRILLVSDRPCKPFPAQLVRIRVIILDQSATLLGKTAAGPDSLRAGPGLLFQQMVNYTRVREWMQESLLDLGDGIQVFVVGSLAEPAVGVLGELLQTLRLLPQNLARKNPFSRVSALLTLQPSETPNLLPDETFAAFREVGRFTFSGPHRMNVSLGLALLVRSALLDHLFLLESQIDFRNNREKRQIDASQALAEALFTLVHPSAKFLWENLINDLRLSGQTRQETHQPIVHGLGIATLYLPLTHIKQYIAARLAFAALFGEKKDEDEGLLFGRSLPSSDGAFTLATRLLRGDGKAHPVFEWILQANGPAYFNALPLLDQDYIPAFQAQLAQELTRALNTPPVSLPNLAQALDALKIHLENMAAWFTQSRPSDPRSLARASFAGILPRWMETVDALAANLRAWDLALQPVGASAAETPLPSAPASGWRASQPVPTASWRKESTPDSFPATVSQTLIQARRQAENALRSVSADPIYRSVISDKPDDLSEIETYYADSIRPELSRFINQSSPAFARVRGRIEWWIRLIPSREPEILLICWPPDADASTGQPPDQGCFRVSQVREFSRALLNVANLQTLAAEADLTGPWFTRRIHHLADFVRRAEDCYLAYDHNGLSRSTQRRSYLISHDPTLMRALVKDIFPDTPRFEINELPGGEATRFTALSLRLNLPAAALFTLQDCYRDYYEKLPENLHLYPQEKTAVLYEKRIWKNERERLLLAVELLPALAEPEWTTLFFQGLFTGIISLHQGEDDLPSWQVNALSDSFPALPLVVAGPESLLRAFLRFTVEIPSASDVELNPQNHFHSTRRARYLRELTNQIKASAIRPETLEIRQKFQEEIAAWRQRGERDLLAKSFALLMAVEYDQSVLKNWS